MKNISIACLCLLLVAVSGEGLAQSCTTPGNLNASSSVSGNTCNGTNEIGTYCGVASSPQKEQIWSVNLASGYTATSISLTNTGGNTYTPALLLFQGTCVNGDNCAANTTAAAGANASLSLSGVSAGAYLLSVTSDPNASSTDCGSYNLQYSGTLPVKLQKFSVK